MEMSLEAFKAFVAREDWSRSQEIEHVEEIAVEAAGPDDGSPVDVPTMAGYVTRVSRLGDVTIEYSAGFSYPVYEPDALSLSTDGMDRPLQIHGLDVFDEDGDVLLRDSELLQYLGESFTEFDEDEIAQPKPIITLEDTDPMNTITIERDNNADIRFTGELLGEVCSSPDRARSDFSGSTGRWTVLRLYRTRGGRYVCAQEGHTQWIGEDTRYSAAVCDDVKGVVDFFGYGWLAKELYDECAIDAAEQVD